MQKIEKKLGIWMDHANAHLIEFNNDNSDDKIISSKFTHQEKSDTLGKSENIMHNKEQQDQSDYYKKISAVIKDFNEVILFGPTSAKVELSNILKADHHFDTIKIEIQQTDKMTENQQHAFVKEYFS